MLYERAPGYEERGRPLKNQRGNLLNIRWGNEDHVHNERDSRFHARCERELKIPQNRTASVRASFSPRVAEGSQLRPCPCSIPFTVEVDLITAPSRLSSQRRRRPESFATNNHDTPFRQWDAFFPPPSGGSSHVSLSLSPSVTSNV